MNKKLPKIYHNEVVDSNNKDAYYSYKEEKEESPIVDSYSEPAWQDENFFQYFHKVVDIETKRGMITNTRILSKLENRLLLEDGTYLDVSQIKNIH